MPTTQGRGLKKAFVAKLFRLCDFFYYTNCSYIPHIVISLYHIIYHTCTQRQVSGTPLYHTYPDFIRLWVENHTELRLEGGAGGDGPHATGQKFLFFLCACLQRLTRGEESRVRRKQVNTATCDDVMATNAVTDWVAIEHRRGGVHEMWWQWTIQKYY